MLWNGPHDLFCPQTLKNHLTWYRARLSPGTTQPSPASPDSQLSLLVTVFAGTVHGLLIFPQRSIYIHIHSNELKPRL